MDSETSNVELVRELIELQDHIRGTKESLSAAFEAADEDDLESLRLDDANRALDGALSAVDAAIEKVAAYDGILRAMAAGR